MAGTFPGVSNTQQSDLDGLPLSGGQLYVFIGGTTTLAQTWQNIGLSLPAANPLEADGSGRIPLFFVADGTYRVRLTDEFGSTANGGFDYPQVPSIGASSSGGGGTSVDPSTIFQTGWWTWQPIDGLISGYVRANGRTIGGALSGASERANADCQPLFIYIWQGFTDAQCPVPGGRGSTALADFQAGKQITLPDMRGRTAIGLDTMGNATAGRLNGALFSSGDGVTPLSLGGEATHILSLAEAPPHHHTGATAVTPLTKLTFSTSSLSAGGTGLLSDNLAIAAPQSATLTIPSEGGGSAHNNMQPFATGTFFIKL